MNQAQRNQLAAFSLRKAIGQTRNLLYVEGQTVTVPLTGHRTKTVLKAVRSWIVDAYRKPAKKESDKNVKLADHDAVFVWQGFDQFGVKAALPMRDAFLIDNGRNEVWRITHVKPIETFDALYIVTCKPYSSLELSISYETEASAGIGILASASFSVTDLIFIRPPASPASIDLSSDWQTVPFSVFGPPPALQGDVRTACISSMQAVGASYIEFELQRSVEPEGGKIWERVESGLAQINGWGYCRMVWNDEPPWIAPGNLLRYRVKVRLVSGYARIFNPEFTIKAEMIVQRTQGNSTVEFDYNDLAAGPINIIVPSGKLISVVYIYTDTAFDSKIMMNQLGIGLPVEKQESGSRYRWEPVEISSGFVTMSSEDAPAVGAGKVVIIYC